MPALLRRVTALLVVVTGTIGAPIGLWVFGRSLLPTELPGWETVWAALTTADNGRVLAGALLLAATALWLVFLGCVLLEVTARLTHRPTIRVPGLRLPQAVAGALIALILSSTITVAGASRTAADPLPPLPQGSASPAAITLTLNSAPADPSSSPIASSPAESTLDAAPRWTVEKGDTLWGIAEATLGDPLRYPEIVALNAGRTQPDGGILRHADWLRPGWVLALPADAQLPAIAHREPGGAEVVVAVGDTLSGIAATHHTDLAQVWAANAGRAEPGGERLTDPDLIHPGWSIRLPTSASSTAVNSGQEPVKSQVERPVKPRVTDDSTEVPPADTPSQGDGQVVKPPESVETAQAQAPTPPPVATSAAPPTAAPTGSGIAETVSDQGGEDHADWSAAAASAGGLLLAGGAYASLRQLNRRRLRRRRPGKVLPTTASELLPLERALATTGRAGYLHAAFLDQALRSLSERCATTGTPLPPVIAARLSPTTLELLLDGTAPTAPEPWVVTDDATRWTLARTDQNEPAPDETAVPAVIAPYPALVSVAHTADGKQLLLDLEQLGRVRLTGDPAVCRNLARFIAAELAHNPWSDTAQVTLIGWEPGLADLNPGRVTVTATPDRAAREAITQRRQVLAAPITPLEGRRDHVTVDAWAPHILITAPDPAAAHGADDLVTLQVGRSERSTIAVVVTTDDESDSSDAKRIHVGADGALSVPGLGLAGIAEQLTAEEAHQLGEFLTATRTAEDQPAPPAAGDRPWHTFADALGAPLPGDGVTADRDNHNVLQQAGTDRPSSVLPLSDLAYASAAATTTSENLGALAPWVSAQARRQVEQADPDLDDDLRDWYDPHCTRPKITVLGPVRVQAPGPLDPSLTGLATEVVIYLATRPHGATVEEYAGAIWATDAQYRQPDGSYKPKVRKVISSCRRWLGTNPRTGLDHLPRIPGVRDAVYRIDDALLDADLFRRLRLRGCAHDPDTGIPDLTGALNLVTGQPFDRRRTGGYGWLVDNHLDYHYLQMLTDVAHTLAAHHLHAGHPHQAIHASQVAITAGATDDTTRLNLHRAHTNLGDYEGADRHLKALLDAHDADDEVDLPPQTFAVLHGNQWKVS
jgi:LysM domain